jgi:hypothetical protein
MALSGQNVEVVGPGIHQTVPEKSSYAHNMVFNNEAWEVRKGFGQMCEYDSTLSQYTLAPGNLLTTEGYTNHLGSYLMKTNFGHKQIISLFMMSGWTSNGVQARATDTILDGIGQRQNLYVISIYDITTRERWEEPIVRLSAEQNRDLGEMPNWHGVYETNNENRYGSHVVAPTADQASFTEMRDILFFGNSGTGILYYKPCTFIGNRSKALDPTTGQAGTPGYSEPSVVDRLRLSPGIFNDAYSYLSPGALPRINTFGKLENRLIYCADHTVFFADNFYPASIISGHSLSIPSENTITAVKEINGNLLIWTKSETFLYQPNRGDFVDSGQLTKISETIGCLSSNSYIKFNNLIVWVDANGVHINGGDLNIKTISDPIKKFFTNYISNPLGHFELTTGRPNLENDQPKIQYSLDPKDVTITYCHQIKAALITIPEQRCSLVYNNNGEWSLWSYDSSAFYDPLGLSPGANNEVGIRTYMDARQLLSDEEDLYSIGLDFNSKITSDEARNPTVVGGSVTYPYLGTPINQDFKSYFICRYGRGGGCDRNIDDEDERYGIGEWRSDGTSLASPAYFGALTGTNASAARSEYWNLFIGQPQSVAPGYAIEGHTMTNGGILLPIIMEIPDIVRGGPSGDWTENLPMAFEISFQFDRHNWTPLYDGAGINSRVLFLTKTPMETLGAGMGNNTLNFLMSPYRECRTYDLANPITVSDGAGAAMMRIGWNAYAAGEGGVTAPADISMQHFYPTDRVISTLPGTPTFMSPLPIPLDRKCTLMWIPFEKRFNASVSSMNIQDLNGQFYTDLVAAAPIGATNYYLSNNYIWDFSSLGSTDQHWHDNVAQGVDWAYSSPPIGLEEGMQIKSRGFFADILSHGTSANPIDNSWDPTSTNGRRLFNSTVSNDNTQWIGQTSDFQGPDGTTAGRNNDPTNISSSPPDFSGVLQGPGGIAGSKNSIRTRIRNSANQLGYNTFDDGAQTWGQDGTTTGTVLVDDPQFGTIAESNSVRGSWVSWMFFGHVLDKAEKLILRSADTIIRHVGGRRRKGR